ncbi:MAG: hypothetical protein JW982_12010 [Spirochaetes bacterium]|nr:hypothetical protein [Spirochaetota bacterium]
MRVSDKSKIFFLIILLFFSAGAGLFWMDYIGIIDLAKYYSKYTKTDAELSVYASDDEPSLIALEEFEKQKEQFAERVEELDKRQAVIEEQEKEMALEFEKIEEIRKGLELEKKRLEDEKTQFDGYQKNVAVLAEKIVSMPPVDGVAIMIKWDDPLIIDVLRQMDRNAEQAGTQSITSYLISLMPKEKAARIMYLMTQI